LAVYLGAAVFAGTDRGILLAYNEVDMSIIDWLVLVGTLLFIAVYGAWKTRGSTNIEGYLRGDSNLKWWSIGLSVMATQASAITFLSTPGQAYESGMGFVQFYFGLPIAMVIICLFFIPLYFKLKVYTAYEFLEKRFDLKTRWLTAFLFLIQRGLAAGITIYAPAIILSSIFGWPLLPINILLGATVIIYTVSGGSKAVSVTQNQQMAIMIGGMAVAFFVLLNKLPDASFGTLMEAAGQLGKMDIVKTDFDLSDRYNIYAGIIGGGFLALSYFGTDQSQVARYLGGKSIAEMRLGLLFNGIFKIPMQFFILLTGILVFLFYQFNQPPVFFNGAELRKVEQSVNAPRLTTLTAEYETLFKENEQQMQLMLSGIENDAQGDISSAKDIILVNQKKQQALRDSVKALVIKTDATAKVKDTDYVFITFVMDHLPVGVVGLIFASVFCAAMSSTSSELNALASTTCVDFYKRSVNTDGTEQHYVTASKWFTLLWGLLAIVFASIAPLFENLIQLVNIVGSIFYGTILGIFLVAFLMKWIKGNAVFIAAIIAESLVVYLYLFHEEISFLWFNVIGCVAVMFVAALLQPFMPAQTDK
jgi:SSS family transporter